MRLNEISPEQFKHNKKVTFNFMKNTEKAPYYSDNRFGQNLEPSGEFVTFYNYDYETYKDRKENKEYAIEAMDTYNFGTLTFNNPYVIDENISTGPEGWKKDLSDTYNGKTGKKLSNALMKDGYDGVVIYDSKYGEPAEIVNLNGTKTVWE